jgi:hypothetical protein
MATQDANLDYEPLALDEQKESFRSDPVQIQETRKDPINTPRRLEACSIGCRSISTPTWGEA